MSRLISILVIGVGGFYLFQKRYRLLNMFLGNIIIRRLFIRTFMNIPGVRNKIMGSIFPQTPNPV